MEIWTEKTYNANGKENVRPQHMSNTGKERVKTKKQKQKQQLQHITNEKMDMSTLIIELQENNTTENQEFNITEKNFSASIQNKNLQLPLLPKQDIHRIHQQ